jgi:hypothetical protein
MANTTTDQGYCNTNLCYCRYTKVLQRLLVTHLTSVPFGCVTIGWSIGTQVHVFVHPKKCYYLITHKLI